MSVINNRALVCFDGALIFEHPFVAWSEVGDNYEKMIKTFGDEGVDDDWFQLASEKYLSRFE